MLNNINARFQRKEGAFPSRSFFARAFFHIGGQDLSLRSYNAIKKISGTFCLLNYSKIIILVQKIRNLLSIKKVNSAVCLLFQVFVYIYSYLFTFIAICLHFQLFVVRKSFLTSKLFLDKIRTFGTV